MRKQTGEIVNLIPFRYRLNSIYMSFIIVMM